jgi:hypothetical protein
LEGAIDFPQDRLGIDDDDDGGGGSGIMKPVKEI